MAATPQQQQENLARLRGNLAQHCTQDPTSAAAATAAATRMPLTHSTNDKAFRGIIAAGALQSNDARNRNSRDVDQVLGSTNHVFLYLGAAAFPKQEVAFIFKAELTVSSAGSAVATPFDSGGCMGRFSLPPGTDPVQFVRDHELPVPDCREYLKDLLAKCFHSIESYLSGDRYYTCPACNATLPDPHGLGPAIIDDHGLDRIHEVRIQGHVDLSPHLCAVLVPDGMAPPELAKLHRAGVRIESYSRPAIPDQGQIHALRDAATDFIMQQYLS
ncbi:MAG: hypothetical protein DVB22_000169 [Verrucomicrobia bacterium]|nr:MAG: hypothetical protein DVB22_000169 [Verrucomicrobiota bacterium]